MSLPSRIRPVRNGLSLGLLLVMAAATAHAADVSPLRICAEPDSLPMSQQSSNSGYDIEVARLLADALGRPLEVKWVSQRDPSYFRATIGAGVCDAIMEVPEGFERLTTTAPWYRTGFVFVSRVGDGVPVTSFDDPGLKQLSIGVPATGLGETPPAIALTRRSLGDRLRPYSIFDPRTMIDAVADKDIDLAVVWGPFGGWWGGTEKRPLVIKAVPAMDGTMPLTFAMSIGVRKGDEQLKAQLDQALVERREAIAAILTRWRVPLVEN